MHLSRFRALDFKGVLKLHISPPERVRTPSRGPPVQALPHPSGSSPLPRPKPTIFPADPCPGLCRHQNGGRGWGKDLGSQGFPLVPHPRPRTHLGLSLPSRLPPDSRRGCAARTLGPADLQRAGVGEPGPLQPSAGRPPPPHGAPAPPAPRAAARPLLPSATPKPQLTTIFDPKKDRGGRRGGRPRGKCFRRVVALGRPALPPERPTIFCRHTRGRCGAWGLLSLRCFAPGDWTDPPKGSACSPHQPQGAAPGPLPGPPAPPPPTLGATPGQHALRATRSRRQKGASDGRV